MIVYQFNCHLSYQFRCRFSCFQIELEPNLLVQNMIELEFVPSRMQVKRPDEGFRKQDEYVAIRALFHDTYIHQDLDTGENYFWGRGYVCSEKKSICTKYLKQQQPRTWYKCEKNTIVFFHFKTTFKPNLTSIIRANLDYTHFNVRYPVSALRGLFATKVQNWTEHYF